MSPQIWSVLALVIGLLIAWAWLTGRVRVGMRLGIVVVFLVLGSIYVFFTFIWGAIFKPPVTDQSSVLYNCYRWDRVTVSMSGQTICTYGKIVFYSENNGTTDIYFSDQPSAFHLVSTTHRFPYAQQGECVKASGEVTSDYGALLIDISDLYEVTPTSDCDAYP